jgi:phosphatidate cytidylyltransferase
MGSVALACNWLGALPFALLVVVIAIAMSWEWGSIVRGNGIDAPFLVQAAAAAIAIALSMRGQLGWAILAVGIGSLLVFAVARADRRLFSMLGVAYVGLPAAALVWLRGEDTYGALAILFIFVVVWTTDTFAYLCGRLIGGPKLWPALSPGKTWAGTLGGIGFAALAGLLFAGLLTPPTASLALAGAAILLSLVSQIGDLAESALKRAFAVKDASHLIPGHGGFMDRMDGIVTAALLAALIAALRGWQAPAQSLLMWS